MGVNKFNCEGYYDPTAYEALTKIEKEAKALRVFRPVVYICSPWKPGASPSHRTSISPNS